MNFLQELRFLAFDRIVPEFVGQIFPSVSSPYLGSCNLNTINQMLKLGFKVPVLAVQQAFLLY
jgi:hypothetical protein